MAKENQTIEASEKAAKLKALEAKLAMTESTLDELIAENEELRAQLGN